MAFRKMKIQEFEVYFLSKLILHSLGRVELRFAKRFRLFNEKNASSEI